MKTFTESQRISDSFKNTTVKIRFIHCKHLKVEQYTVAETINTLPLDILGVKNNGQRCRARIFQFGFGSKDAVNSPPSQWVSVVHPGGKVSFFTQINLNRVKFYSSISWNKSYLPVNEQIKTSHDQIKFFTSDHSHSESHDTASWFFTVL